MTKLKHKLAINILSGIIDPISIIGVLLLVVTLIVGTAVTSNRKISLNISEKASDCFDECRKEKGRVYCNNACGTTFNYAGEAVVDTSNVTGPAGELTCDADGVQYSPGTVVLYGGIGSNAKCGSDGKWVTYAGPITDLEKKNVPSYAIATYDQEVAKQQEVAQQQATGSVTEATPDVEAQNKLICQQDGNTWANNTCTASQQATGTVIVTKQQEMANCSSGGGSWVIDGCVYDTKAPKTSQITKPITTTNTNPFANVSSSIGAVVKPSSNSVSLTYTQPKYSSQEECQKNTNQYSRAYSSCVAYATPDENKSTVMTSLQSLLSGDIGTDVANAIANPNSYSVCEGKGKNCNAALSSLDVFVPDNYTNYWQGQVAKASPTDTLTDIAFNLQTTYDTAQAVSFNTFDDYVSAYSPDKVKINWKEAGYDSAKSCQDDMLKKYGVPQAAASCNTYTPTKEQTSSSIKLGTILTAEGYAVAVAPQLIYAAAETGGVVTAGVTTLGQAQVISTVYQAGDTASYCALNGQDEACLQREARTGISFATLGISQYANISNTNIARIANTAATVANAAVDTGDVYLAYSDPNTDSLTKTMSVVGLLGDFGGFAADWKAGQIIKSPYIKVTSPSALSNIPDIPKPAIETNDLKLALESPVETTIKVPEGFVAGPKVTDVTGNVPKTTEVTIPEKIQTWASEKVVNPIADFVLGKPSDISLTKTYKPQDINIPKDTEIVLKVDGPEVKLPDGTTHPLEVGKPFPNVEGSKVTVDTNNNYHLVNPDGTIARLTDNRTVVTKATDWVNNLLPESKVDKEVYKQVLGATTEANPTKADIVNGLIASGYNPAKISDASLSKIQEDIVKIQDVHSGSTIVQSKILDKLITELQTKGTIEGAKAEFEGRMYSAVYDKGSDAYKALKAAGGDSAVDELIDAIDAGIRKANSNFIYSPKESSAKKVHITYPDITADRGSSKAIMANYFDGEALDIIKNTYAKYGITIEPKVSDIVYLGLGPESKVTFTVKDGVITQSVSNPVPGALLGSAGPLVPKELRGGDYIPIIEYTNLENPDIAFRIDAKDITLTANVVKRSDIGSIIPEAPRNVVATYDQLNAVTSSVGFDSSLPPNQIRKMLSDVQKNVYGTERIDVEIKDTVAGPTRLQVGNENAVFASADVTPFSGTKAKIQEVTGMANSPTEIGFDKLISRYTDNISKAGADNNGIVNKIAGDGGEIAFLEGITPQGLRSLVDLSDSMNVHIKNALDGKYTPEEKTAAEFIEKYLKDQIFVKVGAIKTDATLTIHPTNNGYTPTELNTKMSTDQYMTNTKDFKRKYGINETVMSISPDILDDFTPAQLKRVGLEVIEDPDYGTFLKVIPTEPSFIKNVTKQAADMFDTLITNPINRLIDQTTSGNISDTPAKLSNGDTVIKKATFDDSLNPNPQATKDARTYVFKKTDVTSIIKDPVTGETLDSYEILLAKVENVIKDENLSPLEAINKVLKESKESDDAIDLDEISLAFINEDSISARVLCHSRIDCLETPILQEFLLTDTYGPEGTTIIGFGGTRGNADLPFQHGALLVEDQVVGYNLIPKPISVFQRYANMAKWGDFNLQTVTDNAVNSVIDVTNNFGGAAIKMQENIISPDGRILPKLNKYPSEKLAYKITGLEIGDPQLTPRLVDDHFALKEKYHLPPRDMRFDNPREYVRQLTQIADNNGVQIRDTSEWEDFFKTYPIAGAVSDNKNNQIFVDFAKEVADPSAYAGDVEHELIHALQSKYYPGMPIEVMEYEAYVGANMSTSGSVDPKTLEQSIFGNIFGSTYHWYQEKGLANPYTQKSVLEKSIDFIQQKIVDPIAHIANPNP